MNAIFEDLQKMLEQFDEERQVIGITFRDAHTFHYFEQHNYHDGAFGKTKMLLNFHVPNQPCEQVEWTSQDQLFKYVRRKDGEK